MNWQDILLYAGAVVIGASAALKWLAPRTKNKLDDKWQARLEKLLKLLSLAPE